MEAETAPLAGTVLVTGAAGFIGFHVARRLLETGRTVLGLDNLNDYYDPGLKRARLEQLEPYDAFEFMQLDIANRAGMKRLFETRQLSSIVHLAAQAGVRYSIDHPHKYVDSNLVGFVNVLEGARLQDVRHLVFASSSSVYGANEDLPYSEEQSVDHPVSLYAATKRSDELMAHAYATLFELPVSGLRYFTVYGPWGRPDMAYYLFTEALFKGRTIALNNAGNMRRSFTFIDDAVSATMDVLAVPADRSPSWDPKLRTPCSSQAPFRILNVGASDSVELREFVRMLERITGQDAIVDHRPMPAGDVQATEADTARLRQVTSNRAHTGLEEGLRQFVEWYRDTVGVSAVCGDG